MKWIALAAGLAATPVLADDVLAALRGADIAILGEVHDNPVHHRIQADLVEALRPRAVVFEMFGPDAAAAANALGRRDPDALQAALDWDSGGWPDFAIYAPIFAAAGDVPLYGAALPRDQVRRAVSEGAAAMMGSDSERFGLKIPLAPNIQAEREALQMDAHCDALPENLLPGMVEAQRLRDAAFARTALKALEVQGPPVVVITGNGHARRDWGMPAAIANAAPGVSVVSLGLVEVGNSDLSFGQFDVVSITEQAERSDPCAGFTPGSDG